MNSSGTMKTMKALVPLFILISTFCAGSSFANGVLIFSSWDTEEKATTDAERISGLLEQNATTMEATVNDRNVFRVVVAVSTQEDRSALAQTAEDKNLKPWFLSTEKLSETEVVASDAPSAPTTDPAEALSMDDQTVVSNVSDVNLDAAVLEYLDQATINSTISKLDAVRKRAQDLIPDFEPRTEEMAPKEELPEMPQPENKRESEQQADTSATD